MATRGIQLIRFLVMLPVMVGVTVLSACTTPIYDDDVDDLGRDTLRNLLTVTTIVLTAAVGGHVGDMLCESNSTPGEQEDDPSDGTHPSEEAAPADGQDVGMSAWQPGNAANCNTLPKPNLPASVKGVSIASAPTEGNTYGEGDVIALEVAFTRAVAASPEAVLVLLIGDAARYAAYEGGNGTDVLTFVYAVHQRDRGVNDIALAPDALTINDDGALMPHGKSIFDSDGNGAILNLDGQTIANASTQSVDGGIYRPAEVVAVRRVDAPPRGARGATGDMVVEIVYSKAMTITESPTLELIVGERIQRAAYRGGSGTRKIAFGYAANGAHTQGKTLSALSLNGCCMVDARGNAPQAIPDDLTLMAFAEAVH